MTRVERLIEWVDNLPVQTFTEEMKQEIIIEIEYAFEDCSTDDMLDE